MKISPLTRFVCLLFFCLLTGPALAAPLAPVPGDGLFAQGQFEAARQAYASAAVTTPDDVTPRIGLIRSLLRLDRWAEALTEAQADAKKFPANADAHGLLALALIRAGWQAPDADEAKQALALDANNYWGLVASGRIAEWDGRFDEARKLFRQAVAARPEQPDAWLGLLHTLEAAGDAPERAAAATAYLKINPQGQPHDQEREWLNDLSANGKAYHDGFGADPPFRRTAPDANFSVSMPIEFARDYPVFPVTINGQQFRLILDTGAGRKITLNKNAARRLKLKPLAHSYVRGVSGREDSDFLKAETLTLDKLTYHSIPISTASTSFDDTDGIMGGNIFRDSLVTLDLRTGMAGLAHGPDTEAPAPRPGNKAVRLPFHVYHGHLYLSMTLGNKPIWAVLDTGAARSFLSLRQAEDFLKDVPKSAWRTGSTKERRGIGSSDQQMNYVTSQAEVTLILSEDPPANLTIPVIGISDLDREISPSADFEISMFLGMSSLTCAERLTFDYPRRLLTFEYKDPDALPAAGQKPK